MEIGWSTSQSKSDWQSLGFQSQKRHPDDFVDRVEARLVVRGFTQECGVKYQEIFSPVVQFTSVRVILSLVAMNKISLRQFDIKTAFLNGDLDEDGYMEQPIVHSDGTKKVYKLNKSLYGLKQASSCWNKRFVTFIPDFGLNVCESDPCVFVDTKDKNHIIPAICVDDRKRSQCKR